MIETRPGLSTTVSTVLQTLTFLVLGVIVIWLMLPMVSGTLWIPLLIGALAVSTIAIATRFFDRVKMGAAVALSVTAIAVLLAASVSMILAALVPSTLMGIIMGLILSLAMGSVIAVLMGRFVPEQDEEADVPFTEEEVVTVETPSDKAPGKDIGA
ncbi:MAG: hypothetical protein H9W81_07865 [Enterococcus sp.]|nr:hypothetical protein [Enterococcus sp.]